MIRHPPRSTLFPDHEAHPIPNPGRHALSKRLPAPVETTLPLGGILDHERRSPAKLAAGREDRKSTRLTPVTPISRMPSSACKTNNKYSSASATSPVDSFHKPA